MPPASGNTATSAQVQAVANQITALQASVNALATQVQTLGQQGNAAIAKLTDAINNLAAKVT